MGKKVHGDYGSRLYMAWRCMKLRCQCPGHHSYKFYGGRGIKVCERWQDYANFLADLKEHPGKGYQLDRIDTDGDYEPGNVRWATPMENCQTRRTTQQITFNGKTQSPSAWSRELFGNRHLVGLRLRAGWTAEEALTRPTGFDPGGWSKRRATTSQLSP